MTTDILLSIIASAAIVTMITAVTIAVHIHNVRLLTVYQNLMLDKIEVNLSKLHIAERLKIKKEYGIDLDTFYEMYQKRHMDIEMEKIFQNDNVDN